jgi:prepilin-type N-terminal cleavage/methylation domain-containing protein
MMRTDSCHGTTLLELMVVLVILGLVAAFSSGTLGSSRAGRPTFQDTVLAKARLRAIRDGQPVRVRYHDQWLLFLPDGQARGDGLDQLTGAERGGDGQ